jgi:hypothetical protein
LKNESTQTRRIMFPGFVALVDEWNFVFITGAAGPSWLQEF